MATNFNMALGIHEGFFLSPCLIDFVGKTENARYDKTDHE